MRTSSDVHNYLEERGVAHEMVPLADESATAELAAALLGVPVADIVKSLLFVADGAPVLVLAPGDARVVVERLGRALGAARVTLARAQ